MNKSQRRETINKMDSGKSKGLIILLLSEIQASHCCRYFKNPQQLLFIRPVNNQKKQCSVLQYWIKEICQRTWCDYKTHPYEQTVPAEEVSSEILNLNRCFWAARLQGSITAPPEWVDPSGFTESTELHFHYITDSVCSNTESSCDE